MAKLLLNAQDAVIPTYFHRVLLRMLHEEGIGLDQLFSGLNIVRDQFISDDFRITFRQHKEFIINALSAFQDSHLGWRFGRKINISSLGELGLAIMSSDTGESAVRKLALFFKLRAPSYDLTLHDGLPDVDSRILQVRESFDFGDVRYFMLSCIVSAFDCVFKFLTEGEDVIKRAEFSCDEPEGWDTQASLIDFPVIFGAQTTTLYLNPSFLKKTFITANPDTEEAFTELCQKMLKNVKHQSGIINEINNFIINFPNKNPSLSEAAEHLCISSRTLRRELQKSNTTYQQLLDSVRLGIAKYLLLNTTKTTSEVGFDIGFRDASNFNRAFKSWTGKSPGDFRKHH
ncbi:MAG: AraC family transcriptional regulator [Saccharospirillaceae bacterium]|nr:AraC family transcriptional regulator [Saccharospirillaceae bacterium]MCD8533167.1 AraC family transcriptional regulator [Saccharospirillaceae bacterium]